MIGIKRYYLFGKNRGKNAGCSSVRHASAPAGRGGRTRCRFIETAFSCETYQFYQFYNLDRVCYPQSIRPDNSPSPFFKTPLFIPLAQTGGRLSGRAGAQTEAALSARAPARKQKKGCRCAAFPSERDRPRGCVRTGIAVFTCAERTEEFGICWFLGSSARSF